MSYVFRQNLVASSKWDIKCPYTMNPIGICVHNTSNNASADAEIRYMIGNNNQVSYHFAIDEKEVVQGLPTDRNAWASGDGRNGDGNRKHIHVEICRSTGDLETFKKCEQNAVEFIAKELKKRGWGINKVRQHHDFANKNCPHRTRELGWQRFLNMIQAELNKSSKSNNVASVEKVETIKGEWKIKVLQDTNLWNDTNYKTVGGHVKKDQVLYVTEITKDYNFFVYQGKYLVNSNTYNYVTNMWDKPLGKIQVKQDCNTWSYANFNKVVGRLNAWDVKEYTDYKDGFYHVPYIGYVHESMVNKKLKLTDALVTN